MIAPDSISNRVTRIGVVIISYRVPLRVWLTGSFNENIAVVFVECGLDREYWIILSIDHAAIVCAGIGWQCPLGLIIEIRERLTSWNGNVG